MAECKASYLNVPWRAQLDLGVWCVVTDVSETGPFYWLLRVYHSIAGDSSGEKTARYIARLHNEELKRKELSAN